MSSNDKDFASSLTKLKNANIFSVRVRVYQKLAGSENLECDGEPLNELLNYLLSDMAILSHQSTTSVSEWEAFLKLSLFCLKRVKENAGERFAKLLSVATSRKIDSPIVNILTTQCCIAFLRHQRSLTVSLKRQILDLVTGMDIVNVDDSMVTQNVFSDFLVVVGMLLNENENIQVVAVAIIKTMKSLLETFSRDQKIELLKSVDNEQFRNHIRNLSRSSNCHHLVTEVLLVFIPSCGDVLHSANLANIVLAWATYLAKSLIHDAALSFYVVWTALIDNFSASNAVILSSRHRKLVLSGFGPSLTNAKLRSPELMMSKIRAWWHFVVKISQADGSFLSNAETFSQIAAPLFSIASGDILSFQSSPCVTTIVTPSSFQQSDFGKLVLSGSGKAQTDLVALSCEILYLFVLSSLGPNSVEKLETWLKNKHQVLPHQPVFVEPLAKSVLFGIDATNLAPSLCTVVATVIEELAKTYTTSTNSAVIDTTDAVQPAFSVNFALGTGVIHIFSALLFWLASSIECSQDTGAPHWLQLSKLLENCLALPIDITSMAGLNVTFVTELPSTSYINNIEFTSDEQSLVLLTRLVDLVSKSANSTPLSKNAVVPLSNAADPSLGVSCVEMALMKMLSLFRKTTSSFSTQPSNWKRLEAVCNIVSRQNPVPPAYVIYCWIHNWLRLTELVDGWLSSNTFDLATFTSFLAMPFKLLRLCHVANSPTCCQVVPKSDHQKVVDCHCSVCRRLLDKEFLTVLAAKWCALFNAFCNAPDTDTPRLTRGSGSVIKLCTKLLKSLKPSSPTSCSLPLPFLTFAALCFEAIREKAMAATSIASSTRRTSRLSNMQQQSEATSVFVRCVTTACKESAESLASVVSFAEHVHQQCKKSCSMTTAPLGFTGCSTVKSFVNCFVSLSSSVGENGINEFSNIATAFIPVATALLSSSAKVAEASEAGVCCLETSAISGSCSTAVLCDAIVDGTRQILTSLNRFADVKHALLSPNTAATTAKPDVENLTTNLSQGFSNLATELSNCKRIELKQLAREINRDLWPPGSAEKQSFGTEMLQACALMPDSQAVTIDSQSPMVTTKEPSLRTRGKRASIAVTRSSGTDQQSKGMATSAVFGSLLTSPVKSKANQVPTTNTKSPLFSPPTRRPNTISTTGRCRASTSSTVTATKRPASVLGTGKKPATIDMENSSEFVIVEASQDPFETAKKRKLKATEHQLEVLTERKSDIPALFNTLDPESQMNSLSRDLSSQPLVVTNVEVGKKESRVPAKKKKIVSSRRLCPLIPRVSIVVAQNETATTKNEPTVIDESQNEDIPLKKLLSPTTVVNASPLVDVNVSVLGEQQQPVQDYSSLDLFSSDSAESCGTVLQMDLTIASPIADDDDPDDAETAAMMMLAEKVEADHDKEAIVTNEEEPRVVISPDIVESSLEMVYELSELPPCDVTAEQSNAASATENIICESSPVTPMEVAGQSAILLPSSLSPPTQTSSATTSVETAVEISSTDAVVGKCESPMQQSSNSTTASILRAARVTPSSPGILKRPQSTSFVNSTGNPGGIVETPSPARKTRHVSFSAKTYIKEISPINAPPPGHESVFSSWRSTRKDQPSQQAITPLMPPPQSLPKEPSFSETKPELKPESVQSNSPRVCINETSLPGGASSDTSMVYPSLITCARPIGEILPQIASSQFQHGLLATLRAAGIRTIGDLAKLSSTEARRFPFRTPQVEVLKAALADFEKKVGFQREGISRMAMMLNGRSSTGTMSVDGLAIPPVTISNSSTESESVRVIEPVITAKIALTAQLPTQSLATTNSFTKQPARLVESNLQAAENEVESDNRCASNKRRTVKVDMENVEVDCEYISEKGKCCPSSSFTDRGSQSDDYSLAMAAIIDQLHAVTSKTCSSNDYVVENCEFIAAYSRWCQRAIHPK